ncbi:hypothetical protein HMI54_006150 [Coelomomyces lativittatus]|nr:hypothetical protein HMI54_006150 [Coelomomyces lativittatus]
MYSLESNASLNFLKEKYPFVHSSNLESKEINIMMIDDLMQLGSFEIILESRKLFLMNMYNTIRSLSPSSPIVFILTCDVIKDLFLPSDLFPKIIELPILTNYDRQRTFESLLEPLSVEDKSNLCQFLAQNTHEYTLENMVDLLRHTVLTKFHPSSVSSPKTLHSTDFEKPLQWLQPSLSILKAYTRSIPFVALNELGGFEDLFNRLKHICMLPTMNPSTVSKLGIQWPSGILLYGASGCGKTYMVRALASMTSLNVVHVKGLDSCKTYFPHLYAQYAKDDPIDVESMFQEDLLKTDVSIHNTTTSTTASSSSSSSSSSLLMNLLPPSSPTTTTTPSHLSKGMDPPPPPPPPSSSLKKLTLKLSTRKKKGGGGGGGTTTTTTTQQQDPSILSHLIEPPHFKKSIPSSTSSSSPPPPKPPSSLLFPTTPTTTKLTKKPMGPIDLDKQCGVLGGTQHTPCQRAITCKNHSVGAKRMVKGRSQSYDILVQLFQRQKEKASSLLHPSSHSPHHPLTSTTQASDSKAMDIEPLPTLDPEVEGQVVLESIKKFLPTPMVTRYQLKKDRDRPWFNLFHTLKQALWPPPPPSSSTNTTPHPPFPSPSYPYPPPPSTTTPTSMILRMHSVSPSQSPTPSPSQFQSKSQSPFPSTTLPSSSSSSSSSSSLIHKSPLPSTTQSISSTRPRPRLHAHPPSSTQHEPSQLMFHVSLESLPSSTSTSSLSSGYL